VNGAGPLGIILTLVPSLIIAAAYTATAWFIHRRWHLLGLVILWVCCSAAYGYVSFRRRLPSGVHVRRASVPRPRTSSMSVCSMPSWAPRAFAGATAVVLRYSRSAGGDRLRVMGLVAGTLATLAGWILAWVIVPKPFSW